MNDLTLKLYWTCWVGAAAAYMLHRNKNKSFFSPLRAININIDAKTKPIVIMLDLFVATTLSSFIVFIASHPNTYPLAITAGLGGTGVIAAFK